MLPEALSSQSAPFEPIGAKGDKWVIKSSRAMGARESGIAHGALPRLPIIRF